VNAGAGVPMLPDKERIRARALAFGFDAAGFATAKADTNDLANLRQYLGEGRHGSMAWLANEPERRADAQTLWPEVRTVVALGVNYGPDEDPASTLARAQVGTISVYARGRDYHDVVKRRLKAFGRWLCATYACEVKVFVDTAPVMEKPLAQRAGLGWIGKHTNLVSRRFGSWLFLGEVFTTLELPPDAAETDHCGSCDACLRACPTGALPEPYRIEPRRCISYLSIEHAGEIAADLAARFGNRVYGCDDCLAACPWNRFAKPTPHADLQARADRVGPPLDALSVLDDTGFRARFSGSAIKRIGVERFLRNVRIARVNAGTAPEAPSLPPLQNR